MKKEKTVLYLKKNSIADLSKLTILGGDDNNTQVSNTICYPVTGPASYCYDCRLTEMDCPDEGLIPSLVKKTEEC